MKKPAAVVPVKGANPGGVMKTAAPAVHHHHQAKAKAKPAKVSKAVHRARHRAALKAAATRKAHARKRHLSAGGNCVADACYALTGYRLDGSEDGLFIPEALEILAVLGLIGAFAPAGLDDSAPGLVLGVDLPGPHAVLTVPGGWWSWGDLYDPADFPDAVIEEGWEITWPS